MRDTSNDIKVGDTFAAVSFNIGSTFRAEAVEVKTVKHEVRQVG